MKKVGLVVLLACYLMMLTACSKNENKPVNNYENSVSNEVDKNQADLPVNGTDKEDGKEDSKEEIYADAVAIKDAFSIDDVASVIDTCGNLKTDGEIVYYLPENKDVVEAFKYSYPGEQYGKSFVDSFKKGFGIIFPDASFHEEALWVEGSPSSEYAIKEDGSRWFYNEIESGLSDDKLILVLGYWPQYIEESERNPESNVFLASNNPFGVNFFSFNRGKAVEEYNNNPDNMNKFFRSENSSIDRLFEFVREESPESEEEIEMMDGSIRVCDAVRFFEEYTNSLNLHENPVFDLKVDSVSVYRISDGIYGLYFSCTKTYKNIPFTTLNFDLPGNHSGNIYGYPVISMGDMVKCNEVDYLYGLERYGNILNTVEYDKIMPIGDLIKKASEKLSSEVTFEVKEISFKYHIISMEYNGKMEDGFSSVVPVWYMVLYSETEECYYIMYYNAVSGAFLDLRRL